MKLKDLIEVSSEVVNIRLYDKERKREYSMLEYEESFLVNAEFPNCPELEKEHTDKKKEVLQKYSDWDVIEVWGFDNGLNIVIKGY